MNILYHHRIRSKDGQYVHVEELTEALKAAGHEIVFVGPNAIESNGFGSDAGPIAWLKRHMPAFLYELLEAGYSFLDFLRLAVAIRRHRPDVIYERYNLFLPSGIWAKKLFRLPLLLEVNAPLFAERAEYDGLALGWLAKKIEDYTWRGADVVLPVTEVLAGIVAEANVPRQRIRVIPNGINRARFANVPSREAAKSQLGLDGKFVLGFAGFFRDWHGIDRVIDFLAADRRDEHHLLLVGDGPAHASLLEKAEKLSVLQQITITGIVMRDELAPYLAAFDIALQPNVVAYASPLKLFEYLALGHAIVAPAVDNIEEILDDGVNALLFDPHSDSGFFDCIRRLRDDDALRRRIGERARATIDERGLTWSGNADRVVETFRTIRAPGASESRVTDTG